MSTSKTLAQKNSLGVMAKKIGTTHRYSDGKMLEVTIFHCNDMPIIQQKTSDKDGYNALQIAYGEKKQANKAIIGHYGENKAAGNLVEFRVNELPEDLKALDLSVLDNVISVNVRAKSKGKGFAGPVKRWGFRTQDATHGNSLSHRAHGSTGQCQDPGRVFKGKKMAGRMGHTNVTIKNLQILEIDKENKLLYIVGSVPGSVGTFAKILPYMIDANGGK